VSQEKRGKEKRGGEKKGRNGRREMKEVRARQRQQSRQEQEVGNTGQAVVQGGVSNL
jgi:hypothetical protein